MEDHPYDLQSLFKTRVIVKQLSIYDDIWSRNTSPEGEAQPLSSSGAQISSEPMGRPVSVTPYPLNQLATIGSKPPGKCHIHTEH